VWKRPAVLWPLFTLRKPWAHWLEPHAIDLEAADDSQDRLGYAYVLTSLGRAFRDLRRFEDARDSLREAITLWDDVNQTAPASCSHSPCATWGPSARLPAARNNPDR
jgi:hypothetical protein